MAVVVNDILKAFKLAYPKLDPTEIFDFENGYLVTAPLFKDEIDYSDPYYYVSYDLSEIKKVPLNKKREMFRAFATGPIWTK